MARTTFVGRNGELQLLNRLWTSHKATFLILYGRRRVGKTRLLTHWMQQHEADVLYWMAEPTSALDQLRSFSQALVNFADPDTPASPDFSYDSWEHAFRQVALLTRERRVALLIDEVTYIVDVNSEFVGILQKVWDHWLSDADLLLGLCGSQMGLMQKHLLDYQAPLYGRATAVLKLPPLSFGATREFFPTYTPADRAKIYAIWGGIPAYWERLDPDATVFENLAQQLSPSSTWMLDEPRLLMQDFVTDPYNYVGIMRAIADGKHAIGDIAKRIGLTTSATSMYLSILRDTGFVVRRVPVTKRGTESRLGRYYVTDPYLRFYYRFLAAYQSKLALGKQKQMVRGIEDELPLFVEANTWQEMCTDWLLLASEHGAVDLPVEEVGSEWKRSYTIDVVGLDQQAKHLIMGSCFWSEKPDIAEVLDTLQKRSTAVIPDQDEWLAEYLLFTALSWTDEERAEAEAYLRELNTRRSKVSPIRVRLLDLAQVDEDLTAWTIGMYDRIPA